jgi:NADH dehydrogenase
MAKTRIVIAGGGFAGLSAARYFDKRLARDPDIDVVLISRENFVLFTPMLHEVAAGELYPGDIISPVRRILHHVRFVEAEIRAIDPAARRIRCVSGAVQNDIEFPFDHLLLTLGSETNFFGMADVREWAVTLKNLSDAGLLRNRMVSVMEQAAISPDGNARRRLLTFVIAGGGFAGTETTGAMNDFVRETARYYRELNRDLIRVVLLHPGDFLLPELGEELGRYAERKLLERKVEVIKGTRVTAYDGSAVRLSDGKSIEAATLVWTAGVTPSAVIDPLPFQKERGRLLVDEFLALPGCSDIWAAGDCAAVRDRKTGNFHPPTAQHGLREGTAVAKNIEAAILGRPRKAFVFSTLGQLATIGRRTGVAMIFGVKFSGFSAWWLWRTVYLLKLPRLAKKLRVMTDWALDLLFGREIEQMVTVHDAEALSGMLARIRRRSGREST